MNGQVVEAVTEGRRAHGASIRKYICQRNRSVLVQVGYQLSDFESYVDYRSNTYRQEHSLDHTYWYIGQYFVSVLHTPVPFLPVL